MDSLEKEVWGRDYHNPARGKYSGEKNRDKNTDEKESRQNFLRTEAVDWGGVKLAYDVYLREEKPGWEVWKLRYDGRDLVNLWREH